MRGECPECGAVIELPEDTVHGELVTCECSFELEIETVENGRMTFIPAPKEEEDFGE